MIANEYQINKVEREKIWKTYYGKNSSNSETLKLCKKLIIQLDNKCKSITKEESEYDYYYCHIVMGRALRSSGFLMEAIKEVNIALDYKVLDTHSILAHWMIANIYEDNNQKKEAKEEFIKCHNHYEKTNEKSLLLSVQFNINKLDGNIEGMKNCSKEYKSLPLLVDLDEDDDNPSFSNDNNIKEMELSICTYKNKIYSR